MLKFSDIENWTIVRGPGEAERAAGVVGLVGAKADGTMVLPDGSSPVSGGGNIGPWTGKGRPGYMLVGNSIAKYQRRNGQGGGKNQVSAFAWRYWAMAFLGMPLQEIITGDEEQIGGSANSLLTDGIWGWSGGTSVEIASVIDAVLSRGVSSAAAKGQTLRYVFVECMENDPPNVGGTTPTMTAQQCTDAYTYILRAIKGIGAIPIWLGCLPSSEYGGATQTAAAAALTLIVERLCYQYEAVFVPVADLFTNTESAFYVPLNSGTQANMVYAAVHPMRAAVLIGRRVADVLDCAGIKGTFTAEFPHGPALIGGNLCMAGTGGVLSGLTGAAPANIQLFTGLGSPTTATATLVQETLGRQAVDVVVASSTTQSSGQTALQVYNTTGGGGYTSGWSVGDLVMGVFDVELTASPVGLGTIDMQLNMAGSDGTQNPWGGVAAYPTGVSTGARDMDVKSGQRMLHWCMGVVPAGTTGIRPFGKIYTTLASGATAVDIRARVRGMGVINLSTRG